MMLASRGIPADIGRWQRAGYLFDLKIDGVRCQATIEGGVVTLVSRRGETITAIYPEVVDALIDAFGHGGRVVLDGEITVMGEDGFPSFLLTQKRNAQSSPAKAKHWSTRLPAKFCAFDLLEFGGNSLRKLGFAERRQALELHCSSPLTPTPCTPDGAALWSLVEAHNLEGMIAKRPGSPYRDGRSVDWVKIKNTQTVTCLVGGIEKGEGSRRNTFGALLLYVLDENQELTEVGKVGSGFSDREIQQVMQRLHTPPLIVEVKYLTFESGVLREPTFLRVRSDASLADCTLDQLH